MKKFLLGLIVLSFISTGFAETIDHMKVRVAKIDVKTKELQSKVEGYLDSHTPLEGEALLKAIDKDTTNFNFYNEALGYNSTICAKDAVASACGAASDDIDGMEKFSSNIEKIVKSITEVAA